VNFPLNTDTAILLLSAVSLVLLILIAFLLWQLVQVKKWYKALADGNEGESITSILDHYLKVMEEIKSNLKGVDQRVTALERESPSLLKHVEVVRYNPFKETGGDHSFSLVIADDTGKWVVVSSLHSRDTTRIYAKKLIGWESTRPLTDEESQAIRAARGS
jgi:hypothetical protein